MDRPSDMQRADAEPNRLTYEDYLAFPDDGRRHQLIDGEHVVTPAPSLRHQDVLGNLYTALKDYLRERPIGKVYIAPVDVVLSAASVVQPDLLFVFSDRRDILAGDRIDGAPDLVVEVLSSSTRRLDQGAKRTLYDRFGVRECWLVDPDSETVTVHRRASDGSFPEMPPLSREVADVLTTPLLVGFAVGLSELFA